MTAEMRAEPAAGRAHSTRCYIPVVPDAASREGYRRTVAAMADSIERGDAPTPAYPPLAAQARNLAESVGAWLRAGAPITPRAERERRRAICRGCPSYDADAGRCSVCGCFGAVKPWLGTATCPLGKWDDQSKIDA